MALIKYVDLDPISSPADTDITAWSQEPHNTEANSVKQTRTQFVTAITDSLTTPPLQIDVSTNLVGPFSSAFSFPATVTTTSNGKLLATLYIPPFLLTTVGSSTINFNPVLPVSLRPASNQILGCQVVVSTLMAQGSFRILTGGGVTIGLDYNANPFPALTTNCGMIGQAISYYLS